MKQMIVAEVIEKRIFIIRKQKVMLSTDLSQLYGVEPKVLIQAVKRNLERFPKDFMFQLSKREFQNLKSQFVTSSWGGLRRAMPYAFTEQGVAMLSSVLRSQRAIQVNIQIMRAFVKLRELLMTQHELSEKIHELEKKYESHDEHIIAIFETINQLLQPPEPPHRKIGFRIEEPKVVYKKSRNH